MGKLPHVLLAAVIMLILPTAVMLQQSSTAGRTVKRATDRETRSVPEGYTGTWVCQTASPALTTTHSNVNVITGTLEQTTTTTTPGVVAIKFTLKADGTYEAPNAKGHYSFDPASKAITWLDGLHREKFTKTEIEKRPNGAPSMHFLMLNRYWGCFKAETSGSLKPSGSTTTKSNTGTTKKVPGGTAAIVLAHPEAPAYAASITHERVAQLARQAAAIRIRGIPNLAQVAELTISRRGRRPQNILDEPTGNEAQTKFLRSNSWFKPWGWASEISKRIPWEDPNAPAGSGFARQQAAREKLTKLFSACLDYYEQQANIEGYRTNDIAVTYSHSIALNTEVATGRKLTVREEFALRENLRAKIAHYPYNFDDASKQSFHETLVITTILTQAGYANATLNHDQQAQAAFRETARRNLETLKAATIDDLVHAGWGSGRE
jgi:hypothetical protein